MDKPPHPLLHQLRPQLDTEKGETKAVEKRRRRTRARAPNVFRYPPSTGVFAAASLATGQPITLRTPKAVAHQATKPPAPCWPYWPRPHCSKSSVAWITLRQPCWILGHLHFSVAMVPSASELGYPVNTIPLLAVNDSSNLVETPYPRLAGSLTCRSLPGASCHCSCV